MTKRALTGVAVALAFVLGIVFAARAAATDGAELLFDSAWWLVLLAPFAGAFAAGLTKRRDPRVEGERVLRHDGPAMLEHWTHGIGTAFLLGSGIALGFLFVPGLLGSGRPVWTAMNIHFVAVVMFLFGTFYWAANALLSSRRFKEHLPTKNAWPFTKAHYGRLLGFKGFEMPPEDKYFESEKMAFILALASTATIIVTGILKVLAHAMDLPAWLMGVVTPVHDVAMIAMLAFFLAHVFFGAVLPNSWPVLRSMFTGYISVEQAKKEHAGWYRRLTEKGGAPD
jgi:formate dehydrogenase subunit gamma